MIGVGFLPNSGQMGRLWESTLISIGERPETNILLTAATPLGPSRLMKSRTKLVRVLKFEALSARRARMFAASARLYQGWKESYVFDKNNQSYRDPAHRNSDWAPIGAVPALDLAWNAEVIPDALEIARCYYGVSGVEPTDPGIIRYKPGGFFKPHRDCSPDPIASRRVLTVVLYLNANFSGGRTIFHDLDHFEKPTTGACVVFPPTSVSTAI